MKRQLIRSIEGVENMGILEREAFQQNAGFIYTNWKPAQFGDFRTDILDVGEGETVVVVPIAQSLEAFDSLMIQGLAKNYRVITYRRRENERITLKANDRADDLKKVLNYLHIEKAHFISHSSGSIAATTLALKHPEYFLSYVWMNLSAKPTADLSFIKRSASNLLRYLPISSAMIIKMLSATCAGGKRGSLLYQRVYEQISSLRKVSDVQSIRKWFIRNVWSLARYDWSSGLQVLSMPTLLLNSDNDLVNSVSAMGEIHRQLPNCYGYRIIRGGYHFFQYCCHDQVLENITEFYGQINNQPR